MISWSGCIHPSNPQYRLAQTRNVVHSKLPVARVALFAVGAVEEDIEVNEV
jgi:hypothetical protein